jgi:uncharacterized protein YwqG
MNKAQKKELYENITAHGNNLKKLFKLDNSIDSVKLCKSLFRLENKAQKLTLDFANGVIDQDYFDKKIDHLLSKVENILNVLDQPIFVNNDPRGYALKISDEFVKHKEIFKDWGGYGIIAPDFRDYLTKSDSTPKGFDAIDHLINSQLLDDAMNG